MTIDEVIRWVDERADRDELNWLWVGSFRAKLVELVAERDREIESLRARVRDLEIECGIRNP